MPISTTNTKYNDAAHFYATTNSYFSNNNNNSTHARSTTLKSSGGAQMRVVSFAPGSVARGYMYWQQMRFQQKQQIEREQRRLEMSTTKKFDDVLDAVDATNAAAISNAKKNISQHTAAAAVPVTAATNRIVGNGKVRQMFDERRRGVGIDRANPLKPIETTKTVTPPPSNTKKYTTTPNATNAIAARNRTTNATQLSRSSLSLNTNLKSNYNNNNTSYAKRQSTTTIKRASPSDQCDNHSDFVKGLSSLSLKERSPLSNGHNDNNNNYNKNEKKITTATTITPRNNKLNPVVTKKSPVVSQSRSTPSTSRLSNNNSIVNSANARNRAGAMTAEAQTAKSKTLTNSATQKLSMATKPPPRSAPSPEGTTKCHICGRSFNTERIAKHETVCKKMVSTRRKIFDASKQRVKGTESEKYAKKQKAAASRTNSTYSSAAQVYGLSTGVKKNNWRKKHEDFINTIRAAKKMQAHLAKGGKLSDLPPPPPSENPDYIQCPYCLRRFNQQAAERHIPKCATMIHNKPKPGAKPAAKPAPPRR